VIHKCGHKITKNYGVVLCSDARNSSVQCTGDKLKSGAMGSTRVQDDYPSCKDEGCSRT
jgi:hypothetical protein